MNSEARAAAGAIGGSSNEQASELRARVGALLATSVIASREVAEVGLGIPSTVGARISAETDDPVDDLVLTLKDSGRIFLQVKLRADLSQRPGSATWKAVKQFAEAVRGGLGSGDWLVLATARPVADLVGLGNLLVRRRLTDAGAPTDTEARGLRKVRAIAAQHLGEDEIVELLAHLVIWETDPTQGDGEAALVARLTGEVVESGHGLTGARALTDAIRMLARRRGGLDALGLVDELRLRNVLLQRRIDPSSAVAWAHALNEHRLREVRHGSTLKLFGVPAALAHLPLEQADAQVLVRHEDDQRIGDPLERSLRRLGRTLLVGQAGGGKTTGIGAISAHWAKRPFWPIPVRVHLRRLASAEVGLTQALLDATTMHLVDPERAVLRAALAHKLASGECLLLLDGVDEIGEGRITFLDDLRDWIDELPEGNEILVASRPSAEADAEKLGLTRLRLLPPGQPRRTAEVIIEAAAPGGAADRDDWIDARTRWISDAWERDPSLEQTPLMVVTLAVIAALGDDPQQLPRKRAEILERSLFDVVSRWEVEKRAQGRPALGVLRGTQAREGLKIALLELCRLAIAPTREPEAPTRSRLADLFESEFGLPAAQARSSATDSLQFWLDTGLFSFDQEMLVARSRALAEVGVASSYKDAERAEATAWVASARTNTDMWPALALGAGLAENLTDLWAESLGRDGSVDELVEFVDAISDGAVVEGDRIELLLGRARELLVDRDNSERVAEAIILLPLSEPRRLRLELRSVLLEAIPEERRLLIEALIVTRWGETGSHALDVLRRFVASVEPGPDEPTRGDDGILRIGGPPIDAAYHRTHEAASLRLAAHTRADAELVANHHLASSIDYHLELTRVFRKAGHEDLADRISARWTKFSEQHRALFQDLDFEGDTERLLNLIVGLGPPGALTRRQARRMDDLADLFATAGLGRLHASWSANAPETTENWLRAAAELGGFDLATVTGEAAQLKTEIDDGAEDHLFVYELGHDRDLTQWDNVSAVEKTRRVLVGAFGRIPEEDHNLVLALYTAPNRHQAIPLLEEALADARRRRALLIAWAMLICAESMDADSRARRLMESTDVMKRSAAARWWSLKTASQKTASPEFERCLTDEYENVRREALVFLKRDQLTAQLRDRLLRLRTESGQKWECTRCGFENASSKAACSKCSSSAPNTREAIGKLLDDGPVNRSWPMFPTETRRVRR